VPALVTLLERGSGKRLNEVQLGGDLRQLARADDGTLLVTDYSGDRLLLWMMISSWKRRSPPAIGPMASSSIPSGSGSGSRCSREGAFRLMTGRATSNWMQNRRDSPRLALTDDDRLLLTHAMTGQLAIYDLAKLEKS
jgi:hypothetical protein